MPRIQIQEEVPPGFCWCARCKWAWKPRVKLPQKPVACPDCQNRLWSGEKQ